MVDFRLSSEQEMLQQTAREFAEKEIRPVASHHDRTGEYPLELARKAWELGLVGTHIPEEYGGSGLGYLDAALVAEELGWGCTGVWTALTVNNLAATPLLVAGSEEQKRRFLGPMKEEFWPISYAVTEPSAGSDVRGIQTVARRVGGDYVLQGEKMWITNAGKARWFFVLAYTDVEKGYKGMSGFIVPSDLDGVEVGKKEETMGQRASDTRGVRFEEVRVPKENLVGSEGEGWSIVMETFDRSRPDIGAAAVGLARAAMEYARDYAGERVAFGRPIYQHQGVGFMIADMAKDIDAARLLVWQAAWRKDQGMRNTLQAAYSKCFATDVAMRVAMDAVQIFGGYGFSKEYPVEKLMRDAKVMQIYEGTNQIQRMIMVRELFQRR
ncbi:MAG: acyl-CoA dehydrogenase [Planctomycetota bacterium]|nr:MAG: acyl-CoA dehydrogenase [Planctomycetota bacterium]